MKGEKSRRHGVLLATSPDNNDLEYIRRYGTNEPITRNRTAAFEERLSRLSRLLQGLSLCKQCPQWGDVATVCIRLVSNRAFNWS